MKKRKIRKATYYGIRILLSLSIGAFSLALVYGVISYPHMFTVRAAFEQSKIIESDEEIVITFDKAVLPNWKHMEIATTPSQKINLKWENKNKKLIIQPRDYWKPDTKYSLTISKGKTIAFSAVDFQFFFETEPYPKVEKFYPLDGEKDVVGDIEDPIKVTFDRPISNYSIRFTVDPSSELSYVIDEDGKTIRLLPSQNLQQGKKYTIQTFVKHKRESTREYKVAHKSSFETKPPPPETLDRNPQIRMQQAMRFTEPLTKEGNYIDINLKEQMMVLFESGKAIDAYLISSGKRGMETPTGTFQIYNKAPRVWSKQYSLFMPYWMAILPSGKVGIHELPEWPGGYKEGASHLGTAVSHGCVRLGVGAAKRVYEWSPIGTTVIVH